MLKVNDIPEQVIRDIAGAYHRRLESTGTEAQDEKERDFQRACYLRTALEWLALWLNQQAATAAQAAQCAWQEDEDGVYDTSCGNRFEFIEGGVADNNMTFCPYCGGTIDEHQYNDMPEGE